MKGFSMGAMVIALITFSAAHAQTVTIFQTGFEPSQGYSTGNLNGQNGWSSYLGEDPNFGEIVNTGALSGSQSVLLDATDVVPGTFGNAAEVRRSAVIAPSLASVPLRYVETTGLCKILDPTVIANHENVFYVNFWSNNTPHAASGPGCVNGSYRFGWAIQGSLTIPVQPNTTFQFRHLLDYRTGISRAWMNGQLAFQSSSNDQFNEALYPTVVGMSGSSDFPGFDMRVWYDDLNIKAVYGCRADMNIDFVVNVNDLLAVISAWGACPAAPTICTANIITSGASANRVDVDDLLAVIGAWGPCP
jgi:hypothetical protein